MTGDVRHGVRLIDTPCMALLFSAVTMDDWCVAQGADLGKRKGDWR